MVWVGSVLRGIRKGGGGGWDEKRGVVQDGFVGLVKVGEGESQSVRWVSGGLRLEGSGKMQVGKRVVGGVWGRW